MGRWRYIPLGVLAACLIVSLVIFDRFSMGFITGAVMCSAAYGLAGWTRVNHSQGDERDG